MSQPNDEPSASEQAQGQEPPTPEPEAPAEARDPEAPGGEAQPEAPAEARDPEGTEETREPEPEAPGGEAPSAAEEAREPEAAGGEAAEPEPEGPPEPVAPPVTVYGDGTPVVLLHAFPLDSRMWLPQVEALGGYQVIVPDLRGFGSAKELAGEVTPMDLLADDVAKLLDERELERAVLCGLSMGGYVALAFARRHPERLGGLVLCDTRAGADTDSARDARLAMAERVLAEGVGFLPKTMIPRLLGKTSRERRRELVQQVTATILDQESRGIAAAQRGMAERADSTEALGQIAVPTLVIAGLEDELIEPDESVRMAAEIRDARLIQVPEAGHLVNLEQPEQINEALLDFLAPLWI